MLQASTPCSTVGFRVAADALWLAVGPRVAAGMGGGKKRGRRGETGQTREKMVQEAEDGEVPVQDVIRA